METQFTPGPWTVKTFDNGDLRVVHGDISIAQTFGPKFKANARLIAAAPDLLEAMQELFEQCAMVHKHWGDGSNAKEADAAIEAAKAAIAKAIGR